MQGNLLEGLEWLDADFTALPQEIPRAQRKLYERIADLPKKTDNTEKDSPGFNASNSKVNGAGIVANEGQVARQLVRGNKLVGANPFGSAQGSLLEAKAIAEAEQYSDKIVKKLEEWR